MYFKCVFLLSVLIYVTANSAITSSDHCNEFSITVDEFVNVNQINTTDHDSFDIFYRTKQCRFLNIAIELDLCRDDKTSKYYVINVTYPINDYVSEEYYPELFQNPNGRPTIHEYDILETHKPETTTNYQQNTTIFEATTEISTTDTSYVLTNDDINKSDVKQLINAQNKEDSGMTPVIVVASVAAVASAAVISYYVAHMIKTKLQSGSFRFPEPDA